MELNISYVVGTTLLYMDKLSFEDLNKISNKLIDKGYVIDTDEENIFNLFKEWRDFFMLDLNNNILLNESAKKNKYTVKLIFNSVLDPVVNNDILNAILYRSKSKCKIIKF